MISCRFLQGKLEKLIEEPKDDSHNSPSSEEIKVTQERTDKIIIAPLLKEVNKILRNIKEEVPHSTQSLKKAFCKYDDLIHKWKVYKIISSF